MNEAISPDYRVEWYRTKLSREQLEELNRRDDRLAWLQSLGFLACLLATSGLCLGLAFAGAWWWLIPGLLLHGTVVSFTANAVHELVHGTVFTSKRLNDVFASIFAFVGWTNQRAFWASHREHHLFTLHDPHDQEEVVPKNLTLRAFLRTWVDPLAMWGHLKAKWRVARGGYNGGWQEYTLREDPDRRKVYRWAQVLLIGHGLLLATGLVLAIAVDPRWLMLPVVTSFAPMYGKTLQWLLNQSQHVGMQDHVDDFRLNSRTFDCNPVFKFLYWHMNWHIEHHMYAAVPCYHLSKLHRAIEHDLPPTVRGILPMWWQIITILYRQRFEPGYQFQPQLPGQETAAQATAKPASSPAGSNAVHLVSREVWQCQICGFIYDEALGLPEEGIAPGTAWADIADDWRCPDCGIGKADFKMTRITRREAETGQAVDRSRQEPLVVVGAGLAGYTVIKEYRRRDSSRPISLICADSGDFYSKPMLSNALAAGKDASALIGKSAARMREDLQIDLRPHSRVTGIDLASKTLRLGDEELCYGDLVLALGASPIRLRLAGDAADKVLSVNHLDDYRRLRASLPAGGRVCILGAGLIGCEFANDLIDSGHQVTVLDLASRPLAALTPPAIGAALAAALAARGVDWRFETSLSSVDAGDNGRLLVRLDDEHLDCDVVLSAVGLRPQIELAAAAGLKIEGGILVDEHLQTSAPQVYAVGDCASYQGRPQPYILPIMHHAGQLAAVLSGETASAELPPMPVTVKTPAMPLVLLPPAPQAEGEWSVNTSADGIEAHYLDGERLLGFALSGAAVERLDELLLRLRDSQTTTAGVA